MIMKLPRSHWEQCEYVGYCSLNHLSIVKKGRLLVMQSVLLAVITEQNKVFSQSRSWKIMLFQ